MRAALIWVPALVGCSEFDFHSLKHPSRGEDTGRRDYTDAPAPETDPDPEPDSGSEDGSPDPEPEVDEDTGPEPETGPPEHVPEVCSIESMVHMAGPGPADCPLDHAAFMMDDGSGPNFICCPLPATDILVDDPPIDRAASCSANEVITGFQGQNAFRCTGVNLDRYQVGPHEAPCYFGSGASGGSGVSGCVGHPHAWDVLQQNVFGSDGCSGYPYGALFVSQTDKDCEDMRAVTVMYNGMVPDDPPAGTPVDMFAVE